MRPPIGRRSASLEVHVRRVTFRCLKGAETFGSVRTDEPRRERRVKSKRQAYLPAAVVAAIAVLLQFSAFITRPDTPDGTSRLGALRIGAGSTFGFAIRALDPSYIGRQLGRALGVVEEASAKPAARRRTAPASQDVSDATPQPAPRSTPQPAPAGAGLVKGAGGIALAMSVNRTSAVPNQILVYEITARNDGDQSVTTVYSITTHVPQFTFECQEATTASCTTPGTYDGTTKDPNDPHVVPAQSERTAMIRPHQKVVLRRLRVQVSPAVPSGTDLFNHAHIDVVGDSSAAKTVIAPVVRVR